eukprot:7816559-Pyramimonas_sp.AAC.1
MPNTVMAPRRLNGLGILEGAVEGSEDTWRAPWGCLGASWGACRRLYWPIVKWHGPSWRPPCEFEALLGPYWTILGAA